MSYKVDVVILSWNRLGDTLSAIESCLMQTGVDVYVYVIDQGSDLEVIETLKNDYAKHERVILEFLGENVGVAKGRNVGYFRGSSPYIFSLDNDAKLIEANTLSRVAQKMELENDVAVLSLRIINYTSQTEGESRSFATVYDNRLDEAFDSVRFAGGAHMIRRSIYLEAGGYDSELFFGGEEEELSRKIINIGCIIRYDPEFYVMHRCTNEGRISWQGERFYYLVRNRLYIRMKFSDGVMKVAAYAFGYLIKGLVNFVFAQAIKGVRDSVKLYLKFRKTPSVARLYETNVKAREYMKKNEDSLRGGVIKRIRSELLVKLPKF